MNHQISRGVRSDCQRILQGREGSLSPIKNGVVLITGGTGFVGTWIVEMLASLNDDFGHKISMFLMARQTEHWKRLNPHLAHRSDIHFLEMDVRDVFHAPSEINWVIHAAASPDNRFHSSNPVETMSVIADGTASLLRSLAGCSDLKKFLYISSGLIYGSQPWGLERLPESYEGAPPVGSVSSAYAEAKRFAETYCGAARSQQRLPVVVARPFAFVGPYQSLETPWAVNNFIRDALGGHPIRVLGDGQTVRSYLYGADMAYWFLVILAAGVSGGAYNVGSPEGVTLAKVAGLVASHFTPPPEIRLHGSGSTPRHQRTIFVPEIARVEQELHLTVITPLETALERTVEWNRDVFSKVHGGVSHVWSSPQKLSQL